MGREIKISLAVIAVLLIALGVVFVKQWTGSGEDLETTTQDEEGASQNAAEAGGKGADADPLTLESSQPTVVAATAAVAILITFCSRRITFLITPLINPKAMLMPLDAILPIAPMPTLVIRRARLS